jgi:non-specific serine/threonine protein kinase
MLETVREFGLEQLEGSGETDAVRQAHAFCYLALAEEAEPDVGPRQGVWLTRLEAEHPNLRAALAWFVERGDSTAAVRLAGALWPFWYFHNHLSEGDGWLERALALPGDQPVGPRGPALLGAGILAWARGDFVRAQARHEEGLALARERADLIGEGRALFGLGYVARVQGAYAAAAAYFQDALARFRTAGDLSWSASTLNGLGNVAHRLGDSDQASVYLDEALTTGRALGDRWSVAEALEIAAAVAHDRGDRARTAELLADSLAVYSELRDWRATARCLAGLAAAAVASGQPTPAARLFGASEALHEAVGGAFASLRTAWYQTHVAQVRTALGEPVFAVTWAAGRALTPEAAVAEAATVAASLRASPAGEGQGPGVRASSHPSEPFGLSPRELEVLHLVVAGKTDREIGAALFISPRTAQGHVASIFAKLGVNSRAAATAAAVRANLVPDAESHARSAPLRE